MGRFITNAEMSMRMLQNICEKDGIELTQDQLNHFKSRYAPIFDKLDNDFDDGLGLPRLTELRDKK